MAPRDYATSEIGRTAERGMETIAKLMDKAYDAGAFTRADVSAYHQACLQIYQALRWEHKWCWPTAWEKENA